MGVPADPTGLFSGHAGSAEWAQEASHIGSTRSTGVWPAYRSFPSLAGQAVNFITARLPKTLKVTFSVFAARR